MPVLFHLHLIKFHSSSFEPKHFQADYFDLNVKTEKKKQIKEEEEEAANR